MPLMKTLCSLILIASALCAEIDLNALPPVEDLYVVRGNEGADTVLIALHGGPSYELMPGNFDYFVDFSNICLIEVRQHHHGHNTIFNDTTLTIDYMAAVNDSSVARVEKVVRHFKAEGKTVALLGSSYGAFLSTLYIIEYGTDKLSAIIPAASRLDMPQELIDSMVAGHAGHFSPDDGETLVFPDKPTKFPEFYISETKMKAALIRESFTGLLGEVDLTKTLFITASHDEAVGCMTDDEQLFIKEQGGTVYEIENGNHMAHSMYCPMVLSFIRGNMESVLHTNTIKDHAFLFTQNNRTLTFTSHVKSVQLYSPQGRLIMSTPELLNKSLTLPFVATGFYLLEAVTAQGILRKSILLK